MAATLAHLANSTLDSHQEEPAEHQHQQPASEQLEPAGVFADEASQTKVLAALVLFVITLACGYLPVRMILNQNYVQYAMFAGGGVLMATAFCHLIPEAHDNYRLLSVGPTGGHSHGHSHAGQHAGEPANSTGAPNEPAGEPIESLNIPYVEVTICCGFLFMYIVEQLMVRFINTHTHEHPCDTSLGQLVVGVSLSTGELADQCGQFNAGATVSSAASATSGTSANLARSSNAGGKFYKFLRGLLIVSAFGVHSIFDGVAIGSQESVEKVWTIFAAISCHKLIIAAVVGLELYAATLESHLWTLVHLAIFSVMSPIGIVLVVLAQNSLNINSNHPVMILLQSFATGTLLYIVFIEILQPKEDQAYERNKLGKSVSLIAGFALMLMVLTLIGDG